MMRRWSDLLQLFYPRLCLLCNTLLIEDEQQLCLKCLCGLPRTDYHKRTDNPAMALFAGDPVVKQVIPYLFFEIGGVTQQMIHAIKYYGNKQLAKELGRYAATELNADKQLESVDLLIPVPIHPRKKRARGYNQAESIAEGIASVCQRPINNDLLSREEETASQTRKTTYERHLNVESSFVLSQEECPAAIGKHLLLIDDVITTGATLAACIDKLKQIAGIHITIFSVSIVPLYHSG